MGTRKSLASLFTTLLIATTVAAQAKKPCFVRVVDGEGHPLADAAVTLVWQPRWGMPGAEHVARAVTDERGRCQPQLVVGQLYTAWAIGPASDDGRRRVSEPTARAVAGGLLEVRAGQQWSARHVSVPVANEGGGEHGDDFVHLAFPVASLAERVTVQDGMLELPPAPWARAWIGRRDANGAILQVCAVEPWECDPVLKFAAPGAIPLHVVDAGGEVISQVSVSGQLYVSAQPADCVLASRGNSWFRELAAGGGAALSVPDFNARSPASTWFVVSAPGHRPRLVASEHARSAAVVEPIRAEPIRVELGAPRELQVRVRGLRDGEQVAAQLGLWISANSSSTNLTVGFALPMEERDGVQCLPLPENVERSQLIVRLLPSVSTGRVRTVVLPEAKGEPADRELDVGALRAVALTVRGVDGGLAAAAEVAVFDVQERSMYGNQRAGAVTDVAGRAELLLGDGTWAVYATDGRAHALAFVDAEKEGGELELQLASIPTMQCRVVDEAGQPLAGARFEPHQSRMSGFSGVLRGPKGWAKEEIAADVAYPLVLAGRSGADGVLVVPVQDWRPWHAGFRVRAGERVSEPIQFPTGSDIGDVVVR